MRQVKLRVAVLALTALAALVFASMAFAQNYVVLYRSQAVPADAAQTISAAGGTLVHSYGQIGVAIARSDSQAFRAGLLADNRVAHVSGTAAYAMPLGDAPDTPVADDPLEP